MSQGTSQLRFPYARWPQEQERTHRSIGILQTCPRSSYGSSQRTDCLILTDNPSVKMLLDSKQLRHFLFLDRGDRHSSPFGYHTFNIFLRDNSNRSVT